jgi:diguanylate cyclase (GGDEF)-like protein
MPLLLKGYSSDNGRYMKSPETLAPQPAYYDSLTGLPNRSLFFDRLSQALTFARRNKQALAILFVSLDNLKLINDTLGQRIGDMLLKAIAKTIRDCIRSSDTIARPGRNEFMILLPEVAAAEDAAVVARKILQLMESPFFVGRHDLFLSASIGLSVYPNDAGKAVDMIRHAYTALQRARTTGGNTYMFYSQEMNTRAFNRMKMENGLRFALRRGEFFLHYQPQINLRTGMMSGMEALVRWNKPGVGIVYPCDFIHLMEETGLIIELGEWALREACAQNRKWQQDGLRPVRVSVNLSPRQFFRHDVAATITRVLEETELEPAYLELELTENVFMRNTESVIETLTKIRDMGVHLSLDDFGTGFSSLSYLKHLPIDRLKIVAPFISPGTLSPSETAIARAIVTMAQGLSVGVIAEGVEKAEDLEFIYSLKCDEVQGHIFSHAISAEEMTNALTYEKHFSPTWQNSFGHSP